MKDKKGFVFVETIIVIATVLAGLLALYISYSNMVRNERRRVRYDDPAFIYKTYSVGNFLLSMYDNNGNVILSNKINEYRKRIERHESDPTISSSYYFNILPNDIDFFGTDYVDNNADRKGFYYKMFNDLNIQNVIIISKSMADEIDTKYNSSSKNEIANQIPHNLLYYILSMKTADDDDNQIYLIVEYAEKVNGDACSPTQLANANSGSSSTQRESSCTFYYANMKIEEN